MSSRWGRGAEDGGVSSKGRVFLRDRRGGGSGRESAEAPAILLQHNNHW
jgi:hypothetical protein